MDGSSYQLGHRLGTVAVEDPLTREKVVKSKVLLLYTGGALGWKVDPQGMTYTVLRIHLSVNGLVFIIPIVLLAIYNFCLLMCDKLNISCS